MTELSSAVPSRCVWVCERDSTHRWSLSLMKGCLRVLKLAPVCEPRWMSKSGTSGWNGVLMMVAKESHNPAMPIRFRNSHFCSVKTVHHDSAGTASQEHGCDVWRNMFIYAKLNYNTRVCIGQCWITDLLYRNFYFLKLCFSTEYQPRDVQPDETDAVWPLNKSINYSYNIT